MLCLSPIASSAHLLLSGYILYRECSRRRAIPCLFWHEAIFWHWQLEASTLQLKAGHECKSVSDSTIDTHTNFFQTKVTDSEEFLRADISWAWLGPYWVLEIKPQDELSSSADTAVDFCPRHLTEQSGTQCYHWIMISCLLFFSSAPHIAKCTIFSMKQNRKLPTFLFLTSHGGSEWKAPTQRELHVTQRMAPAFPTETNHVLDHITAAQGIVPPVAWSEGTFCNNVLEGSWQLFLTLPLLPSHNQQHYSYTTVVCKDQIKPFPLKQSAFVVQRLQRDLCPSLQGQLQPWTYVVLFP